MFRPFLYTALSLTTVAGLAAAPALAEYAPEPRLAPHYSPVYEDPIDTTLPVEVDGPVQAAPTAPAQVFAEAPVFGAPAPRPVQPITTETRQALGDGTLFYPSESSAHFPGYVVRSTIVPPITRTALSGVYGEPGTKIGPWIYFGFGATELTAAELADLDLVGQQLAAYRGDPSVRFVVTGYTDAIGPNDVNRRIAIARARTVQTHLSARFGLPKSRFVLRGVGEEIADQSSRPDAGLHRRVTVSVVRGPVAYPAPTILTEARCTLPATPFARDLVSGRLVASRFESIDDYGGGRLIEYCDLSTN